MPVDNEYDQIADGLRRALAGAADPQELQEAVARELPGHGVQYSSREGGVYGAALVLPGGTSRRFSELGVGREFAWKKIEARLAENRAERLRRSRMFSFSAAAPATNVHHPRFRSASADAPPQPERRPIQSAGQPIEGLTCHERSDLGLGGCWFEYLDSSGVVVIEDRQDGIFLSIDFLNDPAAIEQWIVHGLGRIPEPRLEQGGRPVLDSPENAVFLAEVVHLSLRHGVQWSAPAFLVERVAAERARQFRAAAGGGAAGQGFGLGATPAASVPAPEVPAPAQAEAAQIDVLGFLDRTPDVAPLVPVPVAQPVAVPGVLAERIAEARRLLEVPVVTALTEFNSRAMNSGQLRERLQKLDLVYRPLSEFVAAVDARRNSNFWAQRRACKSARDLVLFEREGDSRMLKQQLLPTESTRIARMAAVEELKAGRQALASASQSVFGRFRVPGLQKELVQLERSAEAAARLEKRAVAEFSEAHRGEIAHAEEVVLANFLDHQVVNKHGHLLPGRAGTQPWIEGQVQITRALLKATEERESLAAQRLERHAPKPEFQELAEQEARDHRAADFLLRDGEADEQQQDEDGHRRERQR